MGSGQSADDDRDASQRPAVVKTSYYELLGVDRQATDDEIKKAYRRKALELHPDRNYGAVERATSLFADVQSAYEVLADPQERAWYDSHEDAILRDSDPAKSAAGSRSYEHTAGLTSAADITRMIARFHGGVDFSDAPSGFFGFLRETFAQLAAEEERATRQEGVEAPDYPSFGHKDDTHEAVAKPFYAVWAGFATRKTFSWRDKYSTRDVGDRRSRRMIEKENKRFRDEGVREFNDAVRSLVAFVRKRDPRYLPNTQSEAERQQALRDAAAAQAARQRAANAAKMDAEVLPEWAKAPEWDPEEGLEGEVGSEEEESDEEQFECVVCRKTFKSEPQFEAHEKSRKHQKAVHALRRRLKKEGMELDLDEEGADSAGTSTPVVDGDAEAVSGDQEELAEQLKDTTLEEPASDAIPSDPESEEQTLVQSDDDDESEIEDGASNAETSATAVASEPPGVLDPSPPSTAPDPQPKLGKAAQKRAKRAAQENAAADGSQHRCAVCNAAFPSKTRLFQHIRDFGHAAAPSATGAGGGGAKGKKKGKR